MRPILAALLCLAPIWSVAADSIVPIEEEPKHVLRFENAHVRYFDVRLPSGYQSLWHTHLHDGVFVNIGPAVTTAQDYGGELVPRAPRKVGETYFINYTKKPKAHRVSNTGESIYHVVDTEIHQGCGAYQEAPLETNSTLVVDNERVRVVRILLRPGQSVTLHPPCGMLVSVSDGKIAVRDNGGEALLNLQPAGFRWRQSYGTEQITNTGTTLFHAVDVLVK